MARTRRSGYGLIMKILVALCIFIVIKETLEDYVGGDDGVEVIGTGDTQVMVAGSTKSRTQNCTPEQMVNQKKCDGLNVLLVNARKMPFIARNTKLAWESGSPALLTMNRPKQGANRAKACPRSFPKPYGGQCDEYPMASTDEGGDGAHTQEVPARENQCQGPTYGAQYPKDGERFLVVIHHPDSIAPGPFTGADIAKDQGWC